MMRKNLFFAVAFVAAAVAGPVAQAQWKPAKPVTMMVMFPAGGGGDILGRAVANFMEKKMGAKIAVENRRGGGGAAMAKALVKAPADGYTIGMAVSETFAFAPVLNPKVGYGPSDFTHLGSIASTQVGLVVKADAPWNDLKELVAAAKAGQEITIGSFSPGSNVIMRLVARHFGAPLKLVPVRGGRAGIQSVMGGHISATLAAGPQAPLIRKGELKLLASAERERLIVGDAPTFIEYGAKDAFFDVKWTFSAPAGLPASIAGAYTGALKAATGDEKLKSLIQDRLSLKLEFTSGRDLLDEILGAKELNAARIAAAK